MTIFMEGLKYFNLDVGQQSAGSQLPPGPATAGVILQVATYHAANKPLSSLFCDSLTACVMFDEFGPEQTAGQPA